MEKGYEKDSESVACANAGHDSFRRFQVIHNMPTRQTGRTKGIQYKRRQRNIPGETESVSKASWKIQG
jgi:hypothetical protein